MNDQTVICAIATAPGMGAIAVIRLSGKGCIEICDRIFVSPSSKKLTDARPNTIHFGKIVDKEELIDEVLISVFRAPHSFTGEDSIEISCHGSVYIQQRILQLLISSGARLAAPGEFTQRAFLNGKMDLSQAEAVADLIASSSAAAPSPPCTRTASATRMFCPRPRRTACCSAWVRAAMRAMPSPTPRLWPTL